MASASKTDPLDDMLAEIGASISDEEVSNAQRTAQEVAAQDVVMTVRMFAAVPDDDK